MYLLYLSLFWLGGIALAPALNFPWVLVLLPVPLILLFLIKRQWRELFIVLCLFSFLGGAARRNLSRPEFDLKLFQGKEIEIAGVVAEEPVLTGRGQKLILKVTEVKETRSKVDGRVLVFLPPFPEHNYGDKLIVKGKLEPAPGRLSGLMFYPQFELIRRAKPGLFGKLLALREKLSLSLKQTMPEPQGALARVLLLGFREDIPKELKRAFSQTGTAHLLAISGLHIGILLGILLSLGVWAFGRQKVYYLLPAFVGIWLYALLSGFRPPTVRASIMGSLFLASEYLGRPRAGLIALSLTAVVMTAFEPELLWEPSFQMSFSAMAGLIILSPLFQRIGSKLPVPGYLIDTLSYSLGAFAGVFPLIAYYFQILSPVSVPATLLALPVLPAIISVSAGAAFAGLLTPILAYPFSWLDWLLLSYLIELVKAFSLLPGAFLKLSPFSSWWLWGYYGVIFLPLLLPRGAVQAVPKIELARWGKAFGKLFSSPKLAWGLLPLVLLIWAAYLSLPQPELSITFFDVGNGDAILIQKGSRQIIIDGGPEPSRLNLELSKRLPFYDRTIDLVVLTHPDADHLRGLLEVVGRYRVGMVMEPGWPKDLLLYRQWRQKLKEKGIPVIYARAGQRVILAPDIKLEVLHPQEDWLVGTDNDEDNNGVVLRLDYNRISFLFTGDLRVEGERELILNRARLKAVGLKVAHHGSTTSSSQEFLKVVRPQVAVISASGKGGLPAPEIINRLKEIVGERFYLTFERGTIEFITDGGRLWLRTER